tara:strand:+ start:841 stop:1107 length:267 start_codon:yes stop_codon:yes gene_type:complete
MSPLASALLGYWNNHMLYRELTITTAYTTVERTTFTDGKGTGVILRRLKAFYIINPATGIKRPVKSLHAAKWRIGRAVNLAHKALHYV